MKSFRAITLSHKKASIDVREAVSLTDADSERLMLNIKEVLLVKEVLILSTCNRTEVYYTAETILTNEIISLLCAIKCVDSSQLKPYFDTFEGNAACTQLFEVALGLRSKVLGDIQIINQVKRAYQASSDLDFCGPFLHRVLHTVFYANKRVATETAFKQGSASLASVSVDLTKQYAKGKKDIRIAVIGLGEIGSTVASNLKNFEGTVDLYNRTKSKADLLAEELSFNSHDFSELENEIEKADVIICAAKLAKPILSANNFSSQNSDKLFIDLGMPRNIHEDISSNESHQLYNIDQLTEKVATTLLNRKKEVASVRLIINSCIEDLREWSKENKVTSVIQQLKDSLLEIRKNEISRYLGKIEHKEMEILEDITDKMIQKIIKYPVLGLKNACKRGEPEALVDTLRNLFDLEAPIKQETAFEICPEEIA